MSEFIKTSILGFSVLTTIGTIGYVLYSIQYGQILEKSMMPLIKLGIFLMGIALCYAIGLITESAIKQTKKKGVQHA